MAVFNNVNILKYVGIYSGDYVSGKTKTKLNLYCTAKKIKALHVTNYPVNRPMANYFNQFKRTVIPTYHHSLSKIITNGLFSNGSITTFC